MKTKQPFMRAKLANLVDNGRNYCEKVLESKYLIIDKKTEREIIDCRIYCGKSASSMRVYASMWLHCPAVGDRPSIYAAGHGTADGGGYHKGSAAVEQAIHSAGIELYGSPYARSHEKPDFKKRAYIGGVGYDAIEYALLAIAHAAGFNDVIMARV